MKKHEYINKEDLIVELRLIKGTDKYYIDRNGNIYKDCGDKWLKMKTYLSPHNGYITCNSVKKQGADTARVHRLVAQAFIPNPENKPVINHKNGIKHDNRVENLEWATIAENTQHAFDNGYAVNAKGYEDSQSNPVYAIDLKTGLILDFGSAKECSKTLNVSVSTVMRQCKGEIKAKPRSGFKFMFQQNNTTTIINA